MNILVVGGAGYIGGAVTDILLNSGHNFKVYDLLIYEETYRKPVEFIYGDVRDYDKLKKYLDWADCVVWLAAFVGDGACQLNPKLSFDINTYSVKWLSENYDGRIVFLSTCSVYGAQLDELDENSPTNPLSVYAASKLKAEEYLANKNAIIFRLGTIYGVSDLFSRIRMDLVVNILTLKAAVEGKLTVFGGNQFRPLLHVKDVASAIFDAINTEIKGIFILHRQNVRIIDLAYQVRNHFPDSEIILNDIPFQDTRNYRVNGNKAKTILNFKAKYSIDDGIEEVKELIESRRIKDLTNPRFTNQLFLKQFIPELENIIK